MRIGQRTTTLLTIALLICSIHMQIGSSAVSATPVRVNPYDISLPAEDTCAEGGICFLDPEPPPPGVDPSISVQPEFGASAEDGYAECDGDGKSGERVQMMYFYGQGQTDRFAQFSDSFRIWSTHMDDVYQNSAAKTGGQRYIRFVHGQDCKISVIKYALPVELMTDQSIMQIYYHMADSSYYSDDRKIVAFMDLSSSYYCGVGTSFDDDSAGQTNYNNTYFGVAVVYNGCWNNGRTLAHELGHMLGAVQQSAPNNADGGHCSDNWDVMCYYYQPVVCAEEVNKLLLDCNNDDYFHTSPPAGSYLATHWNVANSAFLGKPVPSIRLDKTSSKYNGVIKVTLANFKPNVNVNVKWPGNVLLATVKAGPDGKATTSFRTPLVPLGNYQVRASNSQGQAATATLRVIPRILLNETSGAAGDKIRVYYYGFSPGEKVEVRFYNASESSFQVLTTVTIADNGRGSKVVTIPTNTTVGKHKIMGKVIGVSRSASTYFTVTELGESEEPTATPAPTETATAEMTSTIEVPATEIPTIEAPTPEPTIEAPTEEPTAEAPTEEPTTEAPTEEPTIGPPTEEPPSETPVPDPSDTPTEVVVALARNQA